MISPLVWGGELSFSWGAVPSFGGMIQMIGVAYEVFGIKWLHFEDCDFRPTARRPWVLTNVSTATCTSVDTHPPFPTAA